MLLVAENIFGFRRKRFAAAEVAYWCRVLREAVDSTDVVRRRQSSCCHITAVCAWNRARPSLVSLMVKQIMERNFIFVYSIVLVRNACTDKQLAVSRGFLVTECSSPPLNRRGSIWKCDARSTTLQSPVIGLHSRRRSLAQTTNSVSYHTVFLIIRAISRQSSAFSISSTNYGDTSHLSYKKLIRRWDSEHELFTTSYTYYKMRKLLYNLSRSLRKFRHGKIRLAVEFENNTE